MGRQAVAVREHWSGVRGYPVTLATIDREATMAAEKPKRRELKRGKRPVRLTAGLESVSVGLCQCGGRSGS